MTQYQISLGSDGLGNKIVYKFTPYESGHILAEGITRSGKSNLAEGIIKGFIELPKQDRPNFIVIDTEQEFARLRYYDPSFIIFGEEGDLPLILSQARELGKQVRKERLNVIIRITSFFELQERFDFLTEFVRGMIDADQKHWLPTLFFCDEVQLYANSTLRGTSKGALSTLTQTGLKRGILCLYLTQGVKDLFSQIRKQCINRVMGYTEDREDCELICDELLMLPKTDWQKLRELVKIKGSFYARGNDICDYATLFRSQDMGWKTHEEKYLRYPQLSGQGLKFVQGHAMQFSNSYADHESYLQHEIASLQLEIDKLKETQLTPENVEYIVRQAELKGWDQAMQQVRENLIEWKQQTEKPKLLGLVKPKPVIVIFERLPDGRARPVEL